MVMLPGVFSVQNDGDEDVVLWRLERDAPDAAEDVVTGGIKRGLMVEETETVRDVAITKDDCHFLAGRTGAIRTVELGLTMPWLCRAFARTGQDTFIGCEPTEPHA